jgi:sugar lactone lactonase YvrE
MLKNLIILSLFGALVGCGGGGSGASTTPQLPTTPTSSPTSSTAYTVTSSGILAGTLSTMSSPAFLAVDADGNVYATDNANEVVYKFSSNGAATILAGTLGMSGSADGASNSASFSSPAGVVVDKSGNVYVADAGNNTIRKITPSGVVSTYAGLAGNSGYVDGAGNLARFSSPSGLAIDANGTLIVADYGNGAVRTISASGVVSTALKTTTYPADESGPPGYGLALGVAVDLQGNIYFWDGNYFCLVILTPNSSGIGYTAAVSNAYVPNLPLGLLVAVNGIAIDKNGNFFISGTSDDTIYKISQTSVLNSTTYTSQTNVFTAIAGSGVPGGVDGQGTAAQFRAPMGLAVDLQGNLYVADNSNFIIRKISPLGSVTAFAGTPWSLGSSNGIGSKASFDGLKGIASDPAGNLYVADYTNNAIRKITPTGNVSTLSGATLPTTVSFVGGGVVAASSWYGGVNSSQAYANLNTYDPVTGNVTNQSTYFFSNDIQSVAGNSSSDEYYMATSPVLNTGVIYPLVSGPDTTPFASGFLNPTGMVIDSKGNLFVTDSGNYVIRKVSTSAPACDCINSGGVTPNVTTFAGTVGATGYVDGPATTALFNYPAFIAIDSHDNLYVTDNGRIRKITPGGVVSTLTVGWGPTPYLNGIAVANGGLYGITLTAILQTPLSP